LNKIA
jgi:hypothetical protein